MSNLPKFITFTGADDKTSVYAMVALSDADGPRYKAIGNSKAVPVVRWLGRRIASQLNLLTD